MTFITGAQGSVDQLMVSLDEKEVIFNRMADPRLRNPDFLKNLEGQYELNASMITIALRNNELVIMTAPPLHLEPYKDNIFRIREFSDQIVEFTFGENGKPAGLKVTAEGNSVLFTKKSKK
jgi:hypothetical protein